MLNKESLTILKEDSKLKDKKTIASKNIRVVKRNLVYIVGLHPDLANAKFLYSYEGLGKYGDIQKLIINNEKQFNREISDLSNPSAYVTFNDEAASSFAIIALSGFEFKNVQVKANFGMTKYCSYFIKGAECLNNDCLFLHKIAEPEDTYTKVDLLGGLCMQNNSQHEHWKVAREPFDKRKKMDNKQDEGIVQWVF